MKNKIAIIANGTIKNYNFHKKILKDFDIIICADGGANIAKELDITPNYIIGDFDSIKISVFNHFKKINKTKFIKDTDEEKTDLELAISLAETFNPSELKIFGAIGDRIDHTLANIYCLDKISKDISAEIIDDKNTIQLIKKATAIKGEKNDIVSVLPLSDVSNLNYLGFKWNIKNLDTKAGWFGISNKMLGDNASINLSDGKILIVKVRR
jgi:thiamine pyrophosphokinase